MARWTHLFPSRTQKLSTVVATISRFVLDKIARCRAFFFVFFLVINNFKLVVVYEILDPYNIYRNWGGRIK